IPLRRYCAMTKIVLSVLATVLLGVGSLSAQTLYATWVSELITIDPATGDMLSTVQFPNGPFFSPVALAWHPTLGLLGMDGKGVVETLDPSTGERQTVFVANDNRPGVKYRGLAVDPSSGLLWISRDIYDVIETLFDPPRYVYQESYLAFG